MMIIQSSKDLETSLQTWYTVLYFGYPNNLLNKGDVTESANISYEIQETNKTFTSDFDSAPRLRGLCS